MARGRRVGVRLSGPVQEGVARTLVNRDLTLFGVGGVELGVTRLALARPGLQERRMA